MVDDVDRAFITDRKNLLLRRLFINIEQARLYNTRYLLNNGNIKLSGKSGQSALYLAAQLPEYQSRARTLIFRWLLSAGCEFNRLDENGLNLLLWLMERCKLDLLKIFVRIYKMDINYSHTDKNNNSSLMYAVRTKDIDTVAMITDIYVQFGFDVDFRNRDGFTPYKEAKRLNLNSIAQILLEVGRASKQTLPLENMINMMSDKHGNPDNVFSQMRLNISSRLLVLREKTDPAKLSESCVMTIENESPSDNYTVISTNTKLPVSPEHEKCKYYSSNSTFRFPQKVDSPTKRWKKISTTIKHSNAFTKDEDKRDSKKSPDKRLHFSNNLISPKSNKSDGRTSRLDHVSLGDGLGCDQENSPEVPEEKCQSGILKQVKSITYEDLREMMPAQMSLGGKSAASSQEIKWLLALKAEQCSDTILNETSYEDVTQDRPKRRTVKRRESKKLVM